MSANMEINVYSLEVCPNCEKLKVFLKDHNIEYTDLDMSSAENLTELRMNNIFVMEAPVLQIGEDTFLTSSEIFTSGKVNEEAILALINGE